MPSRATTKAYREYLRSDAQALLDRVAAGVEGIPTSTEAIIADTSPPRALHALAEREDVALVVVGSTHHGPAGRVVPGSTGERLLHGSPCPVAIVPRGYADAGPIRTVGVGYDGSDESKAALAAAYQLARRFDAGLRVIRVFDATYVGTPALMTVPGHEHVHEDYEASQREALDEAVEAVPGDVRVEAGFVAGSARHELAAQSERVDLMVVGSRGYGPRAAVLLGGVTHTLLRKAACPVVDPAARLARARPAVRAGGGDRDVVIAAPGGRLRRPPSAPRRASRGSRPARRSPGRRRRRAPSGARP